MLRGDGVEDFFCLDFLIQGNGKGQERRAKRSEKARR